MKTRLSLGSAILLGLKKARCDVLPTTVYLMLGERCVGNCSFCTQSIHKDRDECQEQQKRTDFLSRVIWPEFPFEDIMKSLAENSGRFRRLCLQCLNYKEMVDDIRTLARTLRESGIAVPISVSCVPVKKGTMLELKRTGVDQMTFSVDGATKEVFNSIKGSERRGMFSWEEYRQALRDAKDVFGTALTHLIIGVGETEREALGLVNELCEEGIFASLFAFTPVHKKSRAEKPPDVIRYHTLQLITRLLYKGLVSFNHLDFDEDGALAHGGVTFEELVAMSDSPRSDLREFFDTYGCEGCNRPFYNERPSGPIYNYPKTPTRDVVLRLLEKIRERGII